MSIKIAKARKCKPATVSGNSRNGTSPKTLRGKRGRVQIDVPRDRTSGFEPRLVRKGQTRFDGLDDNFISLYARGIRVGYVRSIVAFEPLALTTLKSSEPVPYLSLRGAQFP